MSNPQQYYKVDNVNEKMSEVTQTTLYSMCQSGNGVMTDKVTSAAAQNGTSDLVILFFVESRCALERIEAHGT